VRRLRHAWILAIIIFPKVDANIPSISTSNLRWLKSGQTFIMGLVCTLKKAINLFHIKYFTDHKAPLAIPVTAASPVPKDVFQEKDFTIQGFRRNLTLLNWQEKSL
jgi:hypothetical protein